MLPNLTTVEVSHMQNCIWRPVVSTRYHNLLQKIWICPKLQNDVTPAIEISVLAIGNGFENITHFNVVGIVSSSDLRDISLELRYIRTLSVNSFRIKENDSCIKGFLKRFPNLTHLNLSFQGWGPAMDLLRGLCWPLLEELRLIGMWTTENEFFDIFKLHKNTLQRFTIGNSALTAGSWRALFTRLRELNHGTSVLAEGELYGRSCRETLNMNFENSKSLLLYMDNNEVSWPFGRQGVRRQG
jgi:hypothetical protein